MRKRVLAVLAVLCLLIPASLGARSLVNVSLGFGASYRATGDEEFSQGLSNPDNWCFHGEIIARLAFIQAQALVFPMECPEGNQGILLVGMGSLNLPLAGSLLSLEAGGGIGLTYIPSNSAQTRPSYILAGGESKDVSSMTFGEALYRSPIYLQVGVATELGPIALRLRYFMSTQTALEDIFGEKGFWSIFNVDSGALSLVLSLKMF